MHILIDIGNSTVVVAIADDNGNIMYHWHFKTLKNETVSYFRHELIAGIKKHKLQNTYADTATISSVVPEVNDDIAQAITDITRLTPHFFSTEDALKVISLDIESPTGLGRDRLADAIGAIACYDAPAIIIDLGTATTIGVVTAEKKFIGGMIIPGVKTSLNALSQRASQLPAINIEKPNGIIGRNTLDCMQSGIIYGTSTMIDGIIDRILPQLSTETKIIATGGMASRIIPYCKHEIIIDKFLQFKGIFFATHNKK